MKENEIALPEGWEVVTLRDVGSIVSGGTPSTANPAFWEGNIPWITPADLSGYNCKTLAVGRKSISEAGLKNSSARLIPKGSVLFSSRAPIGYVVIAGAELCTNQGFKSIVPNTKIESDFLYYFLKGSKQSAEDVASGTTFKEISLKSFAALPIPLPPIAEQHRIVSKIEELFSELEKGKEQILLAQQQLKTYRQAVLKWAFEGRLTNANVEDGVLPEGWEWLKVEDLGKVQLGRQRSPKNVSNAYPTKYIRAANITENGLDVTDILEMEFQPQEFPRFKLEYGDIVLSEASGSASQVGKPAIWKNEVENCCFQNTVIRLRPNEKAIGNYLLWVFKSFYKNGFFANIAGGVGINHLSAGKFSAIELSLPPLEEQHRIVQEIESRLSVCDAMEAALQTNLVQAEVLRQSILKRAFEGRLV